MIGYQLSRLLIRFILFLVARLDVRGLENLPHTGAYAIASNHLGRLDPILVYYYIDRPDIIMLVAEKYREIPLMPWFVKQLNGIFIDRFNADFAVMREALKRLKAGGVLVLAPEGTRSPTGALIQARPGVSYLAAKVGVPIVPVAVFGSEDVRVMANLRRLRRTKITAIAGQPFTLPPLPAAGRDAALEAYTDEIMCRIAALLPPSYRGVYANHPRLQELLSQNAKS